MREAAELLEGNPKLQTPPASPVAHRSRDKRTDPRRKFVVALSMATILCVLVVVTVAGLRLRSPAVLNETTAVITRITRPLPDGIFCRIISFDNSSSKTISDKVEPCMPPDELSKPRSRTLLNWYAK